MTAKTFNTLTLRLDQKPEVVTAMNEIMTIANTTTGQATVEFVILDYLKKRAELEKLQQRHFEAQKNYEAQIAQKEAKINNLTNVLDTLKKSFQFLSQTLL